MTQVTVLDASALLAVALDEPGGDKVVRHIEMSGSDVCIHAVNAFEVVAKLREKGLSEENAWKALEIGHIARVEEMDDELVKIAVRIKHSVSSLSLGDCFCLALTEYIGGTCLTSDGDFGRADTTAGITLFREKSRK